MRFIALTIALLLAAPAGATTVAFDGKTMAADSQITQGGTKALNGTKILRINGCVIACSGDCSQIERFKDWFRDQTKDKPTLSDEFDALVWNSEGCFEYSEKITRLLVLPPCAIGSGKEVALGAMHAGADARRAVEIAKDVDLYTGGPVQTMVLRP